jgi:hypothetical protein
VTKIHVALVVALLLPTAVGLSQEAALTTPNTRTTETKGKIRSFNIGNPPTGPAGGSIELSIQDAGNSETRVMGVNVPCQSPGCTQCSSPLTIASLAGAMNVPRTGETGGAARIQSFRIIGHLFDQGCLPGFQSPAP